ncbi:pseudaminic acid synthase [Chromobacterium piscinae]|uniref:pseudaminic acid synthase n=1 Tax=Chromobacterium piscinae TaxID=686831 RepID=UPI001E3B2392|nr:pseudaminic acid synthase [Chromobacterium piscinae]MCD4506180.1 pseudaminic acid synthase [Chromobacterium piscinae]
MKNNSTFIIAELSANHGNSLELALQTVKAAKDSGADAIKIQTFTPDTITLNCDNDYFQIKQGTLWDGTTLYKLYEQGYTPWDWHDAIKKEAEKQGLIFFSTPFDHTAVDFLETLDVPIYKIASFEITDIPLIEYAASKAKPMIISTGIASIADIQGAINACHGVGNYDITLLKCTSSYPAPVEEANLRTIPNMAETFGVKVGLSDHTMGHSVALAAVALGASVIEKHFILDRSIGGPDASFSMTPEEFKEMVKNIREVELALGRISYDLTDKMIASRKFSRSLFITKDVKEGEIFTHENIKSIRPGDGISPKHLHKILGKRASGDYKLGTPFSWSCVKE